MRLETLKNELPETPDFIHTMIQDEVEKQIQEDSIIQIAPKKKWNTARVAVAAMVCVFSVSTVAYAGTKLYHLYLEKQGKYSVAAKIEATGESEEIQLPKEVHDIEITANYIPEGMVLQEEGKWSYADTPHEGGFSVSSVLMDEDDLSAVLIETGVVESEERSFGEYEGVYLKYHDIKEDKSFNQRIYMLCPEEYRVLTIYIGDDITKEEAVKFAENISIIEKDTMIETAGLYTWSEFVSPEGEPIGDINQEAEDGSLPIHQIGDEFTLKAFGEDAKGNWISADKISVCVDSVQIADDLKLLEGKDIPEEWQGAIDGNGKLLDNHLSYVKSGDGVDSVDQVVDTKDVKQKLVYTTVTYRNDTDIELHHMLYIGSIMLLKHDNGMYRVDYPFEQAGENYDYIMGDGVAHAAEMVYYSTKEDYGDGGNYITSLKPGESIQIEMAWIVNENDLKDMYLNLNGNVYELTEEDMESGVVYIGQ